MKLALASADRILLELTAGDLRRYDLIPPEAEDCAETVRQKLERVLSDLAKATGRHYRLRQRVRIDYLPDQNGGCLLAVAGLECSADPSRRHCFVAQTENDLIDAARAVCAEQNGKDIRITLLKSEYEYYLLTPPLDPRFTRRLTEYMRDLPLHEGASEALKEQCVLLLDEMPLSTLCGGA